MLQPIIELKSASLKFGDRYIWRNLDLSVMQGEFIAVLGPNGSGKSSFLEVLLGLQKLTDGSAKINGKYSGSKSKLIGYVPQHNSSNDELPLRGIDLVRMGLDGHRLGFSLNSKQSVIEDTINEVDALSFANRPFGVLSGGQKQRLRIAQAIVSKPEILFCDEIMTSLDSQSQHAIMRLIKNYQKRSGCTIVFVTHHLESVLEHVTRILYFANGKWALGTSDEILRNEVLSDLYGRHVDVVDIHGSRHIIVNEDISIQAGERYHKE